MDPLHQYSRSIPTSDQDIYQLREEDPLHLFIANICLLRTCWGWGLGVGRGVGIRGLGVGGWGLKIEGWGWGVGGGRWAVGGMGWGGWVVGWWAAEQSECTAVIFSTPPSIFSLHIDLIFQLQTGVIRFRSISNRFRGDRFRQSYFESRMTSKLSSRKFTTQNNLYL